MRRSISRIVKSATLPPLKEENQDEVRSLRRTRASAERPGRKKGSKYCGSSDAVWFYDPNAPVDGQTTMRGRVLLEEEDNCAQEVILTLQNGMLNIQHMQSSVGSRTTSIALQDAHIFPTSKKSRHGIQITFPVSLTQLLLLMERESERDEWVLALQHNSLAHIRLKLDKLTQLQAKTEEKLQEALKTSDKSAKQKPHPDTQLTLLAKENVEIKIRYGLLEKYCKKISIVLEDNDNNNGVVHLQKFNQQIIELVVDYIKQREESLSVSDADSSIELSKWSDKLDAEVVFQLIIAADYLDMHALRDDMCDVVIEKYVHRKTVKSMRTFFGIANDFSLEQERQIRYQNFEWFV